MQFNIITLLGEMFAAMDYGVVGRAKEKGIINIKCFNPRDYTYDNYRKVDDSPYGGGPGMVMLVKPLKAAIEDAEACSKKEVGKTQLVYLTPQGKLLDQSLVEELASNKSLTLVAGRYEGIDERLMDMKPGLEVSIGDYVLSGGELPAMVLIDTIARQIPGVLGDAGSGSQDSFVNGLLDYPHYTRPEVIEHHRVPKVLLGGDHAAIEKFRRKMALGRTWLRRPDLLAKIELTEVDRMLLNEFLEERK
jgi:tRNA (guanine37-N1)-methyltransferase